MNLAQVAGLGPPKGSPFGVTPQCTTQQPESHSQGPVCRVRRSEVVPAFHGGKHSRQVPHMWKSWGPFRILSSVVRRLCFL